MRRTNLPAIPTDQEVNDKLEKIENEVLGHISFKELIKEVSLADIPIAHQHNLEELHRKINLVREAWGQPMVVTSGYRTTQDQLRIYRSRGVPDKKIPMASHHLSGGACDILDEDGKLMEWVRLNEALMIEVGLWIEDDSSQPRVHFQVAPPKSGKRFFKP